MNRLRCSIPFVAMPSAAALLLIKPFLIVLLLRPAGAAPTPPLPGLLIRVGGGECFAFNRGGRFFGQFLENSSEVDPYSACNPTGTAYGDIDGDGRLDLVRFDGIYLGNGDGNFGIMSTAFVNHNSGIAFGCADLNADGHADVLVGTLGVQTFWGTKDGTLEPIGERQLRSFEAADVPSELRLSDLDGDAKLDLLARSANGPHLAFGNGVADFRELKVGLEATHLTRLSDMNADGIVDMVSFGTRFDSQSKKTLLILEVYAVQKGQTVSELSPLLLPGIPDFPTGQPQGLDVADWDGDAKPDILAGNGQSTLAFFRGRGDGTFEDSQAIQLPEDALPSAVLVYDLDQDGLQELVIGYKRLGTRIYWGSGTAAVDFASPTVLPGPGPTQIEVAYGLHRYFVRGDANDDGNLDTADALAICQQLFAGSKVACGDASDVNDSGRVEVTDAILLLVHLYRGGPPPALPYPAAGGDRTPDSALNLDFAQGQPSPTGIDIGCSHETFNGAKIYFPCTPDIEQSLCPFPVRQIIDVCVPENPGCAKQE